MAIGGFFMFLGGLGPWASGDGRSVNGTAGDGWFVMLAGVVAVVLAFALRENRSVGAWPLVAGAFGIAFTAHDVSTLERISGFGVHVGWGLVVALLAAILMGLAGLVGVVQGPKKELAPIAPSWRPTYTPAPGKTCPDCAEEVQQAARVCRFCGYRFAGADAAEASEVAASLAAKQLKTCPDCSEQINLVASSCPSCGYDFIHGRSRTVPRPAR